MAKSGQDGALEVARDRRCGGRLPPGRTPFHKLGGERLERPPEGEGVWRRPPIGRGKRRGVARVVGPHGTALSERDPVRLVITAVAEHPGPCTVRLVAVRDPGRVGETVVTLRLVERDGRRAGWPGRAKVAIAAALPCE